MNFIDFRNRTTILLKLLEPLHFQDPITQIEELKPEDNSGFADAVAKARVLKIALEALQTDAYFEKLSDPRKRLLAYLIFDDSDERLRPDTILAESSSIEDLLSLMDENPHIKLNSYLKQINDFLESVERIGPIYKARFENSKRKLVKLDPGHANFSHLKVDVDADTSEGFFLKPKHVVGTSGLAGCVAACVFARSDKDQNILILGHHSVPEASIINEYRSSLDKPSVQPDSLEVFLVGGYLAMFPSNIQLLMDTDLGITDVRLGLSNSSVDESTTVAIRGDSNDIFYCEVPSLMLRSNYFKAQSSASSSHLSGSITSSSSSKRDRSPSEEKKINIQENSSTAAPAFFSPASKGKESSKKLKMDEKRSREKRNQASKFGKSPK